MVSFPSPGVCLGLPRILALSAKEDGKIVTEAWSSLGSHSFLSVYTVGAPMPGGLLCIEKEPNPYEQNPRPGPGHSLGARPCLSSVHVLLRLFTW